MSSEEHCTERSDQDCTGTGRASLPPLKNFAVERGVGGGARALLDPRLWLFRSAI